MGLNLQIMSDLHLDGHRDLGKGFIQGLDATGVDVLVVAGDLAEAGHEAYGRMLDALCAKYPDVMYTFGNHEWWHAPHDRVLEAVAAAQKRNPNLHVLNDSVVEIRGQRFLGGTLWWRDQVASRMRAGRWIDFRRIDGLSDWIWDASAKARAFLLDNVQPHDVVVTHYLPLHKSLDPRFMGRDGEMGTNCFYLNDLAPIFERGGPALWIHGHTHCRKDYRAGDTRVVCNPLGNQMEETGFIEKLVIELPDAPDLADGVSKLRQALADDPGLAEKLRQAFDRPMSTAMAATLTHQANALSAMTDVEVAALWVADEIEIDK